MEDNKKEISLEDLVEVASVDPGVLKDHLILKYSPKYKLMSLKELGIIAWDKFSTFQKNKNYNTLYDFLKAYKDFVIDDFVGVLKRPGNDLGQNVYDARLSNLLMNNTRLAKKVVVSLENSGIDWVAMPYFYSKVRNKLTSPFVEFEKIL